MRCCPVWAELASPPHAGWPMSSCRTSVSFVSRVYPRPLMAVRCRSQSVVKLRKFRHGRQTCAVHIVPPLAVAGVRPACSTSSGRQHPQEQPAPYSQHWRQIQTTVGRQFRLRVLQLLSWFVCRRSGVSCRGRRVDRHIWLISSPAVLIILPLPPVAVH